MVVGGFECVSDVRLYLLCSPFLSRVEDHLRTELL